MNDIVASKAAEGTMMVCPVCNDTYPSEVEICPADGSGLLQVPDAPLLTGATVDGRYEMGRVIGSGGMGTVYRAWQPSMEREVAVKVLHPNLTHEPRAVKRFFREAQSASRLIHPNIVTIYDFGRSAEGQLYIVMELVQGWTLGDLIYYRAPLEPSLAVAIGLQVADALAEAHKHRIVHRDLKPDNVQLTTVEGRIFAKVLDFGIARMLRDGTPASAGSIERQLSTIEIAGTPAYMSPEQILGKAPDPRSDLYSLGVILFEMLAGQRPFADDNSVSLCMKQINEDPPPLSRFPGGDKVPARLSELVSSLLAKDMDGRPPRADEVVSVLKMLPGSSDAREIVELIASEPGGSLSEVDTRVDASAAVVSAMEMPTLTNVDNPFGQGAADAPASTSLGDVIDRVKLNMPDPGEQRRWTLSCLNCGAPAETDQSYCSLCGGTVKPGQGPEQALQRAAQSRPHTPVMGPRRHPATVVAHLVASNPRVLRGGPLAKWLSERESDGWHVMRQPLGVVVRVDKQRHESEVEAARRLVGSLLALQETAAQRHVPLRVGASVVEEAESPALDAARRLAAVAPPGTVALETALTDRLGLRGRPLSGVFMPDGQPLSCSAVSAVAVARPPVDVRALHGRSSALRRLAQLSDEARREGLRTALVTGEMGSGRTAVLRTHALDRQHLFMRVSPVAKSWPGHTVARLARVALGLPDDGDAGVFEQRVEGLPHRDRALLRLVGLDEGAGEEHATTHEIAGAVLEVLAGHAGEGAFSLLIDDIHHIDPASAAILARLCELAAGKPWLVAGSSAAGRELPDTLSAFTGPEAPAAIELRPLGLRAANAVLEALDVPADRRGPLTTVAQGNPLALTLLAQLPRDAKLPRQGRAIEALLPETLRHLGGRESEVAWLTAVHGHDEHGQRRVQAARLYLDAGLPVEMARWLAGRLRSDGGVYASLADAWRPATASDLRWRAARAERLGLWAQAAEAFEEVAKLDAGGAARERLEAARLRVLAGDPDAARPAIQAALDLPASLNHPEALVGLGAALLENDRDELAMHVLQRAQGAVARQPGGESVQAELAALLARSAVRGSRPADAMTHLSRAKDLVAQLRHTDAKAARTIEARVQEVRAEVALAEGDAESARLNLRQARDAFRDLGRPMDAIRCLIELGRVELAAGGMGRAADTFRAALTLAGAAGLRSEVRRARAGLGEAMLATGEVEEGTRLLRGALREAADTPGEERALAEAAMGMARAMLARGLNADAARYADRARKAAPTDAQRAQALVLLADSCEQKHRAGRYLTEAVDLARRAGDGLILAAASERLEGVADASPRAIAR